MKKRVTQKEAETLQKYREQSAIGKKLLMFLLMENDPEFTAKCGKTPEDLQIIELMKLAKKNGRFVYSKEKTNEQGQPLLYSADRFDIGCDEHSGTLAELLAWERGYC